MLKKTISTVALMASVALVGCDRDPPEEEILEEHQETLQQVDQVTPEAVPVPVPVPVPVDTTGLDTMQPGADTVP